MKTILICHSEHILFKVGLSRWLASFSDLVGLVIIQEKEFTMFKKRLSWEIGRIGLIRLFDVILFRVYYKLFLSFKYKKWEKRKLQELIQCFPNYRNTIDHSWLFQWMAFSYLFHPFFNNLPKNTNYPDSFKFSMD